MPNLLQEYYPAPAPDNALRGLLAPATANPNLLAQGNAARNQLRGMLSGPSTGYEFAQNVGMVPGLGLLSVAGDIGQYIDRPETRNALAYGLTALGAVPFLGALAKMAGPMPRNVLKGQAGAVYKLPHGSPISFNEPEIKDGFTRLYRGGSSTGTWWTPSIEVAEHFMYDRIGKGSLHYIDVPTSEIDRYAELATKTGKSIPDEMPHYIPKKELKNVGILGEVDNRKSILKTFFD